MGKQADSIELQTIYIGLSGLDVGDDPICLPRGMIVERTFAHLMSPMLMAFAPATTTKHHPAPWKAVDGGSGIDITTQISIPPDAVQNADEFDQIATTLMLMIRLVCNPGAMLIASSLHSFSVLSSVLDAEARIIPVETHPRWFPLGMGGSKGVREGLEWISRHFENGHRLMLDRPEFQLAASALNAGQFIRNSAHILISLIGALEVIFSPSRSELKFRVSSLIAAYLEPYGEKRRVMQKDIGYLYDKRSAAAHGKPAHAEGDVVKAFELLRAVMIRIILAGEIPNKEQLEKELFGSS